MKIRNFAIALLAATGITSAASAQATTYFPAISGIPFTDSKNVCDYLRGSNSIQLENPHVTPELSEHSGTFVVYSEDLTVAKGQAIVSLDAQQNMSVAVWIWGQNPTYFRATAIPSEPWIIEMPPFQWVGAGATVQSVTYDASCTNVADATLAELNDGSTKEFWTTKFWTAPTNWHDAAGIADKNSVTRKFTGVKITFADGSIVLAVRPTGQYVPHAATFQISTSYTPPAPIGDPPGAFGIKLGQTGPAKPDYR